MTQETDAARRMPTGILGLDAILNGGLLRGGLYLVVGEPGTGKTVLANQLCFNRAAQGEPGVFISMLTESQTRMLENLQTFSFFDPALVPRQLTYLNGFPTLEKEGLRGLLRLLQKTVRQQKARLLVLDSLAAASETETSELSLRKFLRELGAFCLLTGCTCLLLNYQAGQDGLAQEALSDGIIRLSKHSRELRDARALEVAKFRGSTHLEGRHVFTLSREGIAVHPRTEALLGEEALAPEADRTRASFGIPRLDAMLRGGVFRASTTALLGAPGTGKTLLGLHFLETGARAGEPGLYFGFYESPSRLLSKAEHTGLSLGRHVESGLLTLLWQPPLENLLDELAERLLAAVYRGKVRRLFIDGIDGFREGAFHPERVSTLFTALSTRLRALGVTTLISEETRLLDEGTDRTDLSLSASCENILRLRYVEKDARTLRLLSIIKMRESDYDASLREFRITSSGIALEEAMSSSKRVPGARKKPASRKRGGRP